MQYADPTTNWDDWSDAHGDADEPTRLAALREYIFAAAERFVGTEPGLTPGWMNKKLFSLGVSERIENESAYTLTVPVTGNLGITVYARNRGEAKEKFLERVTAVAVQQAMAAVGDIAATGDPTFTAGPEDQPQSVASDAPQTVDATLAELREVIMLAVVAGPRICENGANNFLADFGLAPIPARKDFTVAQPATVVMTTTVSAYDEDTAKRIAGWRWDNGQAGFAAKDAVPAGAVSVATN